MVLQCCVVLLLFISFIYVIVFLGIYGQFIVLRKRMVACGLILLRVFNQDF